MATRCKAPGLRALLLSVLVAMAGCFATARADDAIELRVMAFNIEWGGTHVSFDKVVEAIRASGADLIAVQEAEGNLERLATELGWNFNERNYAISRFPLLEAPGSDGLYVYAEVAPGKAVALSSVHLPSDPYGPYWVRDGATVEQVVELEKITRMHAIEPYLDALPPLVESGMPVFMAGDFNAPAHTDWTPETVGKRRFIGYAVDWPISRAVVEAGFRDAWREAHPDPVANPGLTWWAARPPLEEYAPGENDPQDRIDFVWFAGPAELVSSRIVGEEGGPEVSVAVSPWPSDHRAVTATFRVNPGALPDLVTTKRRVYTAGEAAEIVFNSEKAARVRLRTHATGREVLDLLVRGNGWARVDTGVLTPGEYRLDMRRDDAPLQGWSFWVQAPGATPSVSVDRARYRVGQPITVSWRNATGYRNDFLVAYPVSEAAGHEGGNAWMYVNAMPEGSKELGPATALDRWPLEAGDYVVRLMKDDGDEVLAESEPFVVE